MPGFVDDDRYGWWKSRLEELAELYKADTPISKIAAHFSVSEDAVMRAARTYGFSDRQRQRRSALMQYKRLPQDMVAVVNEMGFAGRSSRQIHSRLKHMGYHYTLSYLIRVIKYNPCIDDEARNFWMLRNCLPKTYVRVRKYHADRRRILEGENDPAVKAVRA